jgi:hypothetical protein
MSLNCGRSSPDGRAEKGFASVFTNAISELPPMSVSLCLMVRNEEAKLAACLKSAADLADETIVVDTGSTDGHAGACCQLGRAGV